MWIRDTTVYAHKRPYENDTPLCHDVLVELEKKIQQTESDEHSDEEFFEHLLSRCLFPPPGTEISCAVSGGADSLALLVLATKAGCHPTAIHVDHGLREGSGREAEVVEKAAKQLGAQFRSEKIKLNPGPNLEARARAARYGVLPKDVATGHTADDQAETVLLNLLRGSGLDGLVGMRAGFHHPILRLRRYETEEVCRRSGLIPLHDPTNDDPVFLRNRIRHQLLPLCSEIAKRDVVPILTRQAALLAEDADLLNSLVEGVDATYVKELRVLSDVLSKRALRMWIRREVGYPPSSSAVERVLDVVRGKAKGTDLEGSLHVSRSNGRLRLEKRGNLS
jgi:tRNA(Ile)-lysidine synthetase, N-terminal domain